MSKIVLELQKDAMDDSKTASFLLRKALVISKKLQLDDFALWCDKELNGYDNKDERPKYRTITPVYKALNPYKGYIPIQIEDKKLLEVISTQRIDKSIIEIEEYASINDSTIKFSINPELQRFFNSMGNAQFEITAFVARSQYKNICQRVRNLILEWTLELEKEGIMGEDLEFTSTEKERAKSEINNYGTLIMGSVSESEVKSEMINSFNNDNSGASIEEIKNLLNQITNIENVPGIDSSEMKTINSTIAALTEEISKKIPNPNKVSSLFLSMKSIFENAAGSVIASGIIYEINRLFPI